MYKKSPLSIEYLCCLAPRAQQQAAACHPSLQLSAINGDDQHCSTVVVGALVIIIVAVENSPVQLVINNILISSSKKSVLSLPSFFLLFFFLISVQCFSPICTYLQLTLRLANFLWIFPLFLISVSWSAAAGAAFRQYVVILQSTFSLTIAGCTHVQLNCSQSMANKYARKWLFFC